MEFSRQKPKVSVEIQTEKIAISLTGEKSPLYALFREALQIKGANLNESERADYIFQLNNFAQVDKFLARAVFNHAKYFLIIDKNQENDPGQKAEKKVLQAIEKQKLDAKIIRIFGFNGEEEMVVGKILKIALSQTKEKIIDLSWAGAYWAKPNRVKKAKLRPTIWLSLLFLFFLTLPLTIFLSNLTLGVWDLKKTQDLAFSSAFIKGEARALSAQNHFAAAKENLEDWQFVFQILGQEAAERKLTAWLNIGQDLSLASRYLLKAGQEGQKLSRVLLGEEIGTTDEILKKTSLNLNLAEEELALMETRISQPSIFPEKFKQVKNLRQNLVKAKSFLNFAPWFLGERTYLLLFQNNFELRPGGGFIGTVGFIKIENGKLDFKIEDIYTVDGQLKGHVEPPKPIRTYLDQIHWYLRDSNWEADFPTNAQKAAWFLEKEIGLKPDGVIALDLDLVKNLLKLTGPVNLPDYQEKITADNLYLKTQTYTQENFFPGSTQKKDFLGNLANAIFQKIITSKNFPWFGLSQVLEESFAQKHLFVFLDNYLAQKIVLDQGWGGEVKKAPCGVSESQCFDDYLLVLDANLGVNKTNYYLKREIEKETEFNEKEINSQLSVIYKNTSPAKTPLGGEYKNYLRVLMGEKAIVEKIMIDNTVLALDKDVDKEVSFGKNSFGFFFKVAPGQKVKVEILSKIPLTQPIDKLTYRLLVQKQAGTVEDPLTLKFSGTRPIKETDFSSLAKNGGISYNTNLLIDRFFMVKLK
ncbi:MAG: DUF4012 domain-containing protein [Patescibacteria group bacterium]|nr:DUF4012 domain-containing protein [Patescibacteria group bacterium]